MEFVGAGVGLPSLWANVKGQIYLGGEVFVEQMAARAEDDREALEVPRLQRRPRALPLSHFVSAYADAKAGMARAYSTGDYTLAQVAQAFGVHYSTVSRAVRGKPEDPSAPGPALADRRVDP